MKHYLFILMGLILSPIIGATTYYYERVTNDQNKDGHFLTIEYGSCFDSDKDGHTYGYGYASYLSDVNGKHKYRGDGFYGYSIYLFSADYSQVEIKIVETNQTYLYKRLSKPSGTNYAMRVYPSKSNQTKSEYQTTVSSPTISPTPIVTSTQPAPATQKTWHQCHSCRGTGLCTWCRGTGLSGSTDNGYCYRCNGTGKCPGCRGKGGDTY